MLHYAFAAVIAIAVATTWLAGGSRPSGDSAHRPVRHGSFDASGFLAELRLHEQLARSLAPARRELSAAVLRPFQDVMNQAWDGVDPMCQEIIDAGSGLWWRSPKQWWLGGDEFRTRTVPAIIARHLRLEERFAIASLRATQMATRKMADLVGARNLALRNALADAGLAPEQLAIIPLGQAVADLPRLQRLLAGSAEAGLKDITHTSAMCAGALVLAGAGAGGGKGAAIGGVVGIAVGGTLIELRVPLLQADLANGTREQLTAFEFAFTNAVNGAIDRGWPQVVSAYGSAAEHLVESLDEEPLRPRGDG